MECEKISMHVTITQIPINTLFEYCKACKIIITPVQPINIVIVLARLKHKLFSLWSVKWVTEIIDISLGNF